MAKSKISATDMRKDAGVGLTDTGSKLTVFILFLFFFSPNEREIVCGGTKPKSVFIFYIC